MIYNRIIGKSLLRKYDVPGPRYTSYPTVPYWDPTTFSAEKWQALMQEIEVKDGLSIYIHLPFCESLCTYCGCTTRITKNHRVEEPYIEALLKEWKMYLAFFPSRPVLKELHLGGGTPTFFSAGNLDRLVSTILEDCLAKEAEMSFEAHPVNTHEDHLKTLFTLGFRRVSFGIQDFDPEVQQLINRRQTYEETEWITQCCRDIGYQSVNYDLIYGLPKQSLRTIASTVEKAKCLKPDRIAFYSYAHVPGIKPAQKAFEMYLPDSSTKRALFEWGRYQLIENGYEEIGMDHFALPSDTLAIAGKNNMLHRNFMGYTTARSKYLIGLGVSAISDIWGAFAQNFKTTREYYSAIEKGDLPLLRGHVHTEEDLLLRRHILDIMCKFETFIEEEADIFTPKSLALLNELLKDELITWEGDVLKVTTGGLPMVRNVCMAFDKRWLLAQSPPSAFSKTV